MNWRLLLGLSALWIGTHSATCAKDGACDETLKAYQTEQIMLSILDQLPDVGSGATSPRQLMDPQLKKFYQDRQEDIAEKYRGDTSVEILFADAEDPFSGGDPSQLVAAFKLNKDIKNMQIAEALLHVAISLPSFEQHSVHKVHVQVYEKKTDMSIGDLVTTDTFSIKGSQRISIQLPGDAVKSWYTDGKIGGLFVSAMFKDHNVAIHPQQGVNKVDNMILQVVTRDPRYGPTKPSRNRRSATPVCSESDPSEGCCLYNLEITFDKVGWGWVLAPHRYDAFMCKGNCKMNAHHFLSGTSHSQVMREFSKKTYEEDLRHLGFCCHPVEFDYIPIVYMNRDGKAVVKRIDGMVARRCACS